MRMNPAGWMVVAILLFMGASMVVDPDSYADLRRGLTSGIRNFELRLTRRRPQLIAMPPIRRNVIRTAGIVFIALGMLIAAVS